MRIAKWIGIVLLGLVVLLLAGAWLATRFVDPQRFKPQIAAAVRDATGRELQLRGALSLSWFPWLALEANDGALDGQGANTPLISWRKLRIGTRLLPLIDGQLSLDRIQIDGLSVHLQRDAAGNGNWQSLLDKLRAPGSGQSSYALSRVAGITLTDASIEYRGVDGKPLRLQQLNLETGEIAGGKPIGLRAAFDYLPADSAAATSMTIETLLTLQGDELALRNLEAAASWQPDAPAKATAKATSPLRVSLSAAALKANLATQRWDLPAATLTSGSAALQLTNATLTLAESGTVAAAKFVLPPTSLRTLLANLGIEAPVTRDPRALGRFAVTGMLDYSAAGLQLKLDALQLDETRFSGTMTTLTPADVTELSIAGDVMDLDRYRSPENAPSEPFIFPTEKLAALRARGTLTLTQASAMGADLRGVTLRLLFADGRLQSVPAETPAVPPKAVKPAKRTAGKAASRS